MASKKAKKPAAKKAAVKKVKKSAPAKSAKPKAKAKVKAVKAKPKVKATKVVKAKAQPKAKIKAKAAAKPQAKAQPKAKVAALTPVKKVDYSKAITPLGDRLVVRVSAHERITAGGLIIPDTVSEATGFLKATVLAIGRGVQNKKGFIKTMDVQVGDSVLFSQYSGTKVNFNAEELQIIHETDVMGIVQK